MMQHWAHSWPGGRRSARGLNNQDHATSTQRVSPDGTAWTVLAVADGFGRVEDRLGRSVDSSNEAGSWLVAELAAAGAASFLSLGLPPERGAGQNLIEGLAPLWDRLGERAAHGLQATLVLVVVSAVGAAVHMIGDGAWGLCGRADSIRPQLSVLPTETFVDTPRAGRLDVRRPLWGEGPELVSIRSAPQFNTKTSLAEVFLDSNRRGAMTRALEPVFRIDGPVLGAWAATDGLRDQPAVAELASLPIRTRMQLDMAVRRAPGQFDDFAMAWAADGAPERGVHG